MNNTPMPILSKLSLCMHIKPTSFIISAIFLCMTATTQAAKLPPNMVQIPAGEYVVGSNKTDDKNQQKEFGFIEPLFVDEHPLHTVKTPAFLIDKYEVTNAQFKKFVLATNHPAPTVWVQNGYNVSEKRLAAFKLDFLRRVASEYFLLDMDTTTMSHKQLLKELLKIQRAQDNLPVMSVTWSDAQKYCTWLKKRLPTENEWEIAARGKQGYEYPWGNVFDIKKTNGGQANDKLADRNQDNPIAPVGSYPQDKSPFGVMDMAGNVSEWVDDWYQPYAGSTYRSKYYGTTEKVIRGSSASVGHYALAMFFRTALRAHMAPDKVSEDLGFRCAK